jgi:hypothetical protein
MYFTSKRSNWGKVSLARRFIEGLTMEERELFVEAIYIIAQSTKADHQGGTAGGLAAQHRAGGEGVSASTPRRQSRSSMFSEPFSAPQSMW